MGFHRYALILAGSLAAATAAAQSQLVCPPAPAGRPCEAFHFHVQMYRPDNRQFVEISAGTPYATQAACDRARELHVAANARAVDYLRGIKQNFEADRAGPCHCDMTDDKTSAAYLSDAQRTAQLRAAEEIRLRVRERLLDHKLTSESEIVRGLWSEPPLTPMLAGPRLTPLPQNVPAPILTATEDLRSTKTIDTTKPAIAALNLPLADVVTETPAAPPPVAGADAEVSPPPAPSPAAEPTVEEVVVPEPAVSAPPPEPEVQTEDEQLPSAEETAEAFVSYETQRIQNVLRAAGAIDDEKVKSKIFETSMQRIQLLSNLRLLIEGSGVRSRLAAAARDAQAESDRLALIARLFSEKVRPHWAPKDAADVVFEIEPEIVAAPERALRDTTGAVSADQKKRALYLVLAQTQPTEDQRLWLTSIIEGFLR